MCQKSPFSCHVHVNRPIFDQIGLLNQQCMDLDYKCFDFNWKRSNHTQKYSDINQTQILIEIGLLSESDFIVGFWIERSSKMFIFECTSVCMF